MSTFGISMVKDEADVIAGCLRHMASEVDHLLVADNASTDGTRDILADLAGELPLAVVDDPDPAYYQSVKMSRLAEQAAAAGATWIVPFDADEIWSGRGGPLREVLPALPPANVAVAQLFNHYSTAVDPDEADPFQRMVWRQADVAPLPKVAFRWEPGAVIHQGNHGVTLPGGGQRVDALEVRHFPYRSAEQFCNPPEAPIWMADLSFKELGDVDVGDLVMGAARVAGVKRILSVPSEVVAVHRRVSPLVRVEFDSGRWLRCSPDHLWRQHFYGSGTKVAGARGTKRPDGRGWQDIRTYGGDGTYLPAKVGRSLSHVISPTPAVHPRDERLAGWLGGIFDGEGSSDGYVVQLGQSTTANPDVYEDICVALKHFGFDFTRKFDRLVLLGGRQAYVDFFNVTQPRRRVTSIRSLAGGSDRLRDAVKGSFGARYAQPDRIVAVEPDGQGDVIGLTTTTGNYVAWGYASKNCRKARNGAAAYRATDLPEDQGAHWRAYGEILDRLGEDGLTAVYQEHFWYLSPTDSGLVLDPAPYRRWRSQ